MSEKKSIFIPINEREVTRAVVAGFAEQFIEYVESHCRSLY